MADKNKGNQQSKDSQREQKPIKDLSVRKEDMDKVKGGRARFSSDPCEGGESR